MATDTVEPYAFAALRDASWLSYPDVYTLKKWHVDRGNGVAACSNERSWSSRCNPMLDDTTRKPIADVLPHVRCQRPGCRVRWPTPAQDVRHLVRQRAGNQNPTEGTP